MDTSRTEARKGELLLMTFGEYDGYTVTGLVRVLRDFDVRTVMHEHAQLRPTFRPRYQHPPEAWTWLHEQGYIEDMEMAEWNYQHMDLDSPDDQEIWSI